MNKETALTALTEPPITAIKNISISRLKKYRLKGLTYQEIANQLKCSKTNVFNRLNSISFDKEEIEEAKKNLGNIKLADMLRYRSFITDTKLKKTSASELKKMESFAYNEYKTETSQGIETMKGFWVQMVTKIDKIVLNQTVEKSDKSIPGHTPKE